MDEKITKDSSIEALDSSVRAFNCLRNAGINTIGEITEMSTKEIVRIRNMGVRNAAEIILKLDEVGFRCPDCSYDDYPDIEDFISQHPPFNVVHYDDMKVFACDACHSIFAKNSHPTVCPFCSQSTISYRIIIEDMTRLESASAVRDATIDEKAHYERLQKIIEEKHAAEIEALKANENKLSRTVKFITLLLQHNLNIHEHNLALILGYNFLTSPAEYAQGFILSVLNPKDIDSIAGIDYITNRYYDLRKFFTSAMMTERQQLGEMKYEDLYRQTWKQDTYTNENENRVMPSMETMSADTLALNFMKYFKEDQELTFLHTPNRRNITSIPYKDIAARPSDEYKSFLHDWYNGMAWK